MWLVCLILYLAYRSKVGADAAKSLFGKIVFGYLVLLSMIGLVTTEPGIFLFPIAGFGLWYYFRKQKQKEEEERKAEYGWTAQGEPGNEYHENARIRKEKSAQAAGKVVSAILPKNIEKRRRIVKNFSESNKLFLTEEQITSIVNSTYMSEKWKREVEAMTAEYDIPAQWMMGETRWLRAYLHAFTRQDVTYDFKQQEQIVLTAFEQVMRYSDSLGAMPLAERIDRINSRFFTQFNDVTFMIAYRFLEDRGIRHELNTSVYENAEDPVEDLAKKYQKMEV